MRFHKSRSLLVLRIHLFCSIVASECIGNDLFIWRCHEQTYCSTRINGVGLDVIMPLPVPVYFDLWTLLIGLKSFFLGYWLDIKSNLENAVCPC